MHNYPSVFLKKGKESSLERMHPWIFSGAVARTEPEPELGAPVRLFAADRRLLGIGFWEGGSIAVRMISFNERPVDEELFIERLRAAWEMRSALGLTGSSETDAFRLVHGDGDGVPGLILDWYAGHAVLQAHSYGIYRQAETIASALKQVCGDELKQLYDKSKSTLGGRKLSTVVNRYLYTGGDTVAETLIRENGHSFKVNWEEGQKTGFFLDQRDNRARLAAYAKGRRILNAFCYSGGFSIYALAAGAERVVSVDSSGPAISMLEENLKLNPGNGAERHESVKAEVQPFLKERADEFDLIILDPPAFAKHKSARHQAVQGYKRLNQAAMERLKPGSLLMSFSCSQVVGTELFEGALRAAAIEAGRSISVLERLSQPADHPVNLAQPEGEYLKGLLMRVR